MVFRIFSRRILKSDIILRSKVQPCGDLDVESKLVLVSDFIPKVSKSLIPFLIIPLSKRFVLLRRYLDVSSMRYRGRFSEAMIPNHLTQVQVLIISSLCSYLCFCCFCFSSLEIASASKMCLFELL